jgi:hypothetical protein
MPIAKRKANPAVLKQYYERQGKSGPVEMMSDAIVQTNNSRAAKLGAHRKANVAVMRSSGLCKSLG